MYAYIYICIYTYKLTVTILLKHLCMCMYMYVCMYVCMYIYIYIYIYTVEIIKVVFSLGSFYSCDTAVSSLGCTSNLMWIESLCFLWSQALPVICREQHRMSNCT